MTRARTRAAVLVAALLCLFLPTGFAAAQSGASSISGTVRDVSGAALPQATVELVVDGRSVAELATMEDGRYRLTLPADVPFALRVRRAGFAEFVDHLNGTTRDVTRDVTMQVGRVSDTAVVTASRSAEARASVTESVSTLTRGDIETIGASALADALRFVPGLSVEASGREGAVTSVFARGGESDYNLVLIDGVRVNDSGGQFDFSRISASEIERVEVVRGAQSSLWGSDAMGSVVQIFTRRADAGGDPQAFGSVEGGTFNTWRGDLRVAGGARRAIDYQAGVSHRRTDGAFQDRLQENDWFEQTAFDGALGARLGERTSVRTTLRVSRAQARSVGNVTYGSRNTGGNYDTTDLSWHAEVPHTLGRYFAGTGSVNYFRSQSISDNTGTDAPFSTYAVLTGTPGALFPHGTRLIRLVDPVEFNALKTAGLRPGEFLASATSFDFAFESPTEFRRPAVRYQGDVLWSNGQRLSAGYEWERETNPLVTSYEVNNNSFFVQQQSTIAGRWFVTAGVRVDDRESYDTFVSPKLSAGGFVVPARDAAVSSVKLFGNIGKGIKSPTFSERFGGAFSGPSPDLKVERARTADVGIETTFARQRVRTSVAYFNNHYRDQVTYDPVGNNYINIDGSKADGWEFEAALQRAFHGVMLSGSYSLVDTEVETTRSTSPQFQPGQPLLRRPKHSGNLRASYAWRRATVYGDVRVVGDRHDSSFLFLEIVPTPVVSAAFTDISVNPGYTLGDLGVDVRLDRGVTVFVRSNNLTNTTYDAALGYPGLPRTVMAGARFAIGR